MASNIQNRKIKTLTCHDVYNFGASLQAYALMKYLQNLGNQVEVIDYKPGYMIYNLWAIGDRWKRNFFLRLLFFMYVIPRRLMLKSRRKKFDGFTRRRLILTPIKYNSYAELRKNPPDADVYFAGSDQIWNTMHPHGKDPAFYLDFVPPYAIKASYAASFSISEIPTEMKDFVVSNLEKLDAISVREDTGLNILESLNIQGGSVVLDPVFLLDISTWSGLSSFTSFEKYLLVYDQENSKLIKETARKLANILKIKIYAIQGLYPIPYAHKKLIKVGPEEFLGLVQNCEVFLTNSFHGTALSIIFQKEFYTFKRNHEQVNSRMIDLLEMLNLKERLIENPDNINLLTRIDYKKVNIILNKRIQTSQEYIDRVLRIKK